MLQILGFQHECLKPSSPLPLSLAFLWKYLSRGSWGHQTGVSYRGRPLDVMASNILLSLHYVYHVENNLLLSFSLPWAATWKTEWMLLFFFLGIICLLAHSTLFQRIFHKLLNASIWHHILQVTWVHTIPQTRVPIKHSRISLCALNRIC